jgi:hypothetical protein
MRQQPAERDRQHDAEDEPDYHHHEQQVLALFEALIAQQHMLRPPTASTIA